MEGPTPVSALLHAATMVTAGVFLVLRCIIIYQYSDFGLLLLTFLGSITAVFAGMCALAQYDVKKIIAYSTCSQLGYMFLIIGLSEPQLGIGHLIYHAFFKALLFLAAGIVIHMMYDEQDVRRINELWRTFYFTHFCFMVGTFALIALPGFTGFYSKDVISEFTYSRYIFNGYFLYLMGILAAALTSIYSSKLLYNIFMVNHFMLWIHDGGFRLGYRRVFQRRT
jgi:NADH-quinone oxidoreductase subunit L